MSPRMEREAIRLIKGGRLYDPQQIKVSCFGAVHGDGPGSGLLLATDGRRTSEP
jgi:hypothetical protein